MTDIILNDRQILAGPREAGLHMIIGKNFGCTHFEDEFRPAGDVPESANPPLPNAKDGTARACMPRRSCSLSAAAALSEAVARLGLLMMHLAAMAIFAFLACVSFKTLWAQAGAVVFVFVFSGLMDL